jgi:nicotinamide mononucleotide transporter
VEILLATLMEQVQTYSGLEITAVLFAVLYLVLAIRENIWCWLCAMVSTAIYVWLFIGARLYMESVLNIFYFIMAIYGWFVWRSGDGDKQALPVSVWSAVTHLTAVFIIIVLTAASGYALAIFTDAAYPYVDSATTFAAIWATFLVARKVLENWWYWLLIDAVSILIYWSRGLELTALLFVVYVVMIPFGLVSWTRLYRKSQSFDAVAA